MINQLLIFVLFGTLTSCFDEDEDEGSYELWKTEIFNTTELPVNKSVTDYTVEITEENHNELREYIHGVGEQIERPEVTPTLHF